jgi:DNA modification methylase
MPTEGLAIRRVALDSLHLDPSNARVHGEENMEAIIGSLKRFTQVEPLVVQVSTKRVIGGNGRLVAMRKLGWTECDIVELDIDDLQATALGIALNRSGELAAWDDQTLSKLLQELKSEDALDGVGYSPQDLDELIAELEAANPDEHPDEDQVPEPPEAAVSQMGDLWLLGDHRLLVGDSASTEDVDRLLAGVRIDLVNTDPPYNVKVEPRSNNAIAAGLSSFAGTKHHQALDLARHPEKAKPTGKRLRAKDRPLTNDFVSDEEFVRLLDAWFGNMARVLEPGRSFYIWGGYSNFGNYPPAIKKAGLYFSQAIIWDKEHPVLTRKDYMGSFEVCYYGWREGAAHRFFGPNNATDLWHVKKVSPQAMIHLTEKSVELARRALLYSSLTGEHVLDLFGGSGSTLIAAEETKRRAYLMELDELYADVIVTRWEEFTKKEALLENSGKTFKETQRERERTTDA